MINIENEMRGAAPRCFRLRCFVFLFLALSFGSLASNAAPQVLKGNAGKTPCRISSINAATGVVTAKVNSSGQSFRVLVKDSALLRSLKDGLEIFADFNSQQVFTSAGVRLGSILTDNSGKSSAGPAGGANPPQKIEGAQPAGPGSGTNPQPNNILQPNKVAEPAASGGGTNPQLNKMGGGANPAVHAGSANLGNAANPATSAGKNPSIPPTAGSNLGGAAAPAASVSQITNINTPRGIVSAKVNSNGQAFRFFVRDATLLSSLKEGQQIVADFNTQEAFASAGASGRGVRLGSILTDSYGKSSGGAAGGTNLPQKIAGTNLAGPGATGGQPKTESAPVTPGGSKAGMNNVASTVKTVAPAQIQNFAVFPGPIPGGQKDVGRVDLTGVPAGGATVQISSDQPAVASVAAPVQIPGSGPSAGSAVIEVTTSPVTQSTDVILTAQVVGSSQVSTTKLTVRPPQLSILDCSPGTFPSGTPIHCKVWLDGPAPGSAVRGAKAGAGTSASSSTSTSRSSPATSNPAGQVQISTNNSTVASIPGGAAQVPPGADETEVDIPSKAYPESVPLTVSASYGGMSKSASVTLTSAAIRDFGCVMQVAWKVSSTSGGNSYCEAVGGPTGGSPNLPSLLLHFSGPTPASFVKVSSNPPGLLQFCNNQNANEAVDCNPTPAIAVPAAANQEWGAWGLALNPVSTPTLLTVSARDPLSQDVKNMQVKILPPSPTQIYVSGTSGGPTYTINAVPVGGLQVRMGIQLNGLAPQGGIAFDVIYRGVDAAQNQLPTAITGPPRVTVPEGPWPAVGFDVTVQPCEVNSPCTLTVTIGSVTGTIYANP